MIRKKIHIGCLLILLCQLWPAAVDGAAVQMADLPYLCDFEDEAENANWILNPAINTINTRNEWVIGGAAAYTGQRSMYVSQDGGLSNTYASDNNVLLAYRDITLEAGDYDIAYDWAGVGNGNAGYLKIVYADRPVSGLKCLGNSVEPSWVSTSVQLTGDNVSLVNGDAWRHVQARITIPVAQANLTTTRLLFVWVNTGVTVRDSVRSVAIDNFQLAKASPNDYPGNIHVSTVLSSSTVTWEGNAESYEVMYRKKTDNGFSSLTATGNSVTLTNVEYGAYEFWICGVNGGEKTVYTVFPVVYLYETDCFDALNMYNAGFEYGKWKYLSNQGVSKEVEGNSRVDYGSTDIRSRHTTHFDKREIDPRTIIRSGRDTVACLHTVPEGEFGSVRLGNWGTGYEYESMVFHYEVESQSTAVLLIRYAMVLENPDHQETEQPRFTLDVLDSQGEPINTKCASVDFHAPASTEWEDPEVKALWHVNTWTDGNSSHTINWQDWNTIGISVEDYVGETLTIVLTSYDCGQGGHFGYAYFTMNCVRSDVDGLPWGDGSSTRMFTAPEGFDYAWFNRTDTAYEDTILNTNPYRYPYISDGGRFFYVVESDTNTYICHVTYPTNAECGYWFDASAKPHNPEAEMAIRWTPQDCRNGLTWFNRCHVTLTNQLTGEIEHRYDKQLENCYLILEDGTEQPVRYPDEGTYVPMPDEGGRVRYGIWTGIYVNDRLYADTAWYEFAVPAIGPIETHLYDTLCRGQSVFFPAGSQLRRTEPGTYADSLLSSVTGCDSVVSFHLYVHEPVEEELYDTICPDGSYAFAGRTYTAAGVYTGLFESRVTGCDSVVTLHLDKAPRPSVSLLSAQLCSDEPLVFVIGEGRYIDTLRIRTGAEDTVVPVRRDGEQVSLPLTNSDVGTHAAWLEWTMPWCGTVWRDTLVYGVSLASSIIERHWDDMLLFLSPERNGGLTFLSYQWYADGEPIEGATGSYYYEPEMDWNTVYTVHVTMADGTEAWVCPFTPEEAESKQGMEDIAADGKARKILRDGQIRIIVNGSELDIFGRAMTEIQPRQNRDTTER